LRILVGAIIPLVIVQDFTTITGAWALSIFGFIGIGAGVIPYVMYFFGPWMRMRSRYADFSVVGKGEMKGSMAMHDMHVEQQ